MVDLLQNGMDLWNSGLVSLMPSALLIYIAILWISLIFWTIRDSFLRSENFLFQFFAVLLVTFFSIFGFFVYLIIRPPLFLAEKKLLAENFPSCPKCQNPVELRSDQRERSNFKARTKKQD